MPPVCLSCGYPIGHLKEVFDNIRTKMAKKQLGDALPSKALESRMLTMDMREVFAILGIPVGQDCCFTCLATTQNVKDVF